MGVGHSEIHRIPGASLHLTDSFYPLDKLGNISKAFPEFCEPL